jgi:hypothetical protein
VIYAASFADTPFEDLKWKNEYAVFVKFTEDGKRISRIEEMVDTAFYTKFSARFREYLSQQGGAP